MSNKSNAFHAVLFKVFRCSHSVILCTARCVHTPRRHLPTGVAAGAERDRRTPTKDEDRSNRCLEPSQARRHFKYYHGCCTCTCPKTCNALRQKKKSEMSRCRQFWCPIPTSAHVVLLYQPCFFAEEMGTKTVQHPQPNHNVHHCVKLLYVECYVVSINATTPPLRASTRVIRVFMRAL